MGKTVIGISLDSALLKRLDASRGMIPRSRLIEKMVTDSLGDLY
jgi:metal-responsive CopG/Arc/MetJ family transcriptional regulator